jgi:hypothetical protein
MTSISTKLYSISSISPHIEIRTPIFQTTCSETCFDDAVSGSQVGEECGGGALGMIFGMQGV